MVGRKIAWLWVGALRPVTPIPVNQNIVIRRPRRRLCPLISSLCVLYFLEMLSELSSLFVIAANFDHAFDMPSLFVICINQLFTAHANQLCNGSAVPPNAP